MPNFKTYDNYLNYQQSRLNEELAERLKYRVGWKDNKGVYSRYIHGMSEPYYVLRNGVYEYVIPLKSNYETTD